MHRVFRCTYVLAMCLAITATAFAQVQPERAIVDKSFQAEGLTGDDFFQEVRNLRGKAANDANQLLEKLGAPGVGAVIDSRSGRLANFMPALPMIPGSGVGNNLSWGDFNKSNKPSDVERGQAAWNAVRGYLQSNASVLGINMDELAGSPVITVYDGGELIHIHTPRVIGGIPVKDSYLKSTVRFGNLILFGAHKWDDIAPGGWVLTREQAEDQAASRLGPITGSWGKTEQVYLTLYNDRGQGYRYVPAWSVKYNQEGDLGSWEVLLNARNGKVLEIADRNAYAEVKGGVYPVTNDGVNPDGVEQAGWPMPFADVSGGLSGTTDTGGNIAGSGSLTTDFYGPYVNINDNCGSSSLTATDVVDWGTSGGDDCTTPGFGGAGNTHSSRTGFYELNKMIEMGRGQLPSNSWLQQRLTSNMNINSTCNAFWNGTVNFYRSGGGCSNTGEIAGVFDHEWGHGMDANDATPGIASPSGEGIADMYTALRLNDSCIGRNFQGSVCSGNGNTCNTCTGVRDIDYQKKSRNAPHTYSYSNANCGGSVHCVGHVYSEAMWSLWKRKLQSAPYNYDNNTAHEIVNRLTYIAAGNTGTWFSGGAPNGGCAGTSGYQNYLVADDDNGNLNDGTPHMAAIYAAFNDQEIACSTPSVQDAGCSGAPSSAPSVNASASDKAVDLSWNAISGASNYEIFRTEGVFGCNFGKVKIAEITGTSYTDTGLQNGREYSYVVMAKGSSDACFGPASSCAQATPVSGPGFGIDTSSANTNLSGGDGDAYLDNCESATTTFTINNTGAGTLTGVSITNVTASNGGVSIDSSSVASSTIAQGGSTTGTINYTAGGLSHNETLTFTITVDTNETASKNADISIAGTETDLTLNASLSFTFESGTEGFTTGQGTFNRTNGSGAGGTSWYEQSSANLDNQCDQITSPTVVFSSTTTLSLSTNYDIEPIYTNNQWYDRANVGLLVGGNRTAVSPDSGRAYDASGANGNCGTSNQAGWAGPNATWASSGFSAGALGSAGLNGQEVQLDFRYGTDASLNGTGFRFDEVTLTDVYVLGPDAQSDTCGGPQCVVDADCDNGAWCDGAETCNAGVCQAGTAPNCDDGISCTVDSCNEGTDSCDNVTNDGLCDNGLFCDGAETCSATLGCQAGTAPNCDDGVSCTNDSCNEGTDSCDNVADNSNCDDGAWCNGSETCDAVNDCQAGTPQSCAFGCDESNDVCFECSVDADCDDGLFCNGTETCNAGSCSAGSDPCPGQSCDESGDVCTNSNGPQDAVYDSGLGAPACAVPGSECDSLTLLDSRGNMATAEPNQPNTIDGCTDGSSGTYHNDESNDRLVVKTLDGSDFVEGATVQVEATVWGWNTGTSDHLDLYYAADANNPSWQPITTINLTSGGAQTLTATYTLPAGSLQAVRANFRYNGSQSSCSTGSYDDADDLVFAVNPAAPECTVDADCDDGLFCNGAETCNAGTCNAGSDPCSGQSCDEAGDVCTVPTCAVDDDFEAGAPNWTNNAGSTCTTGDYITGNPTNATSGWQIVGSNSGVSSIFTATNTSAGVNDVDGGNCILDSPTWNVPNASNLSVWYWFGQRDAGDDASGDFQILEYSIDGGTNWITLASNGDSTITPAWTNATASIPAGSTVQIRMQCSDGAGPGDLVECGLDDVSICQ